MIELIVGTDLKDKDKHNFENLTVDKMKLALIVNYFVQIWGEKMEFLK